MSNRITYFDNLRGLAIIGVIAIHASDNGLHFESNDPNYYFIVAWRQLLNFSVPLFLAISGYFMASKSVSTVPDYLNFLKIQIPKVYIPLFFWSIIWFALATLIYKMPIQAELLKLIAFQSSGPYYFIALIIQFYLLLPALQRLANHTGLCISLVISIGAALGISYIRHFTNVHLPLIVYAGNFVTWLVFLYSACT